ncbi:MAG: hypothetical protein IPJ58_13600 [Ardenticatenia bacterium]|nr:hypothetical protein [Ardenticatenia bacterium]
MSDRIAPGTEEELISAIDELLADVRPPETVEEVETFLRECGYDSVDVAARMQALVDGLVAQSPLNWRNRAPQEMEAARAKREGVIVERSDRNGTIAAIKRLYTELSEGQRQFVPAALFRNLETASDSDLADLQGDLEYLKTAGK